MTQGWCTTAFLLMAALLASESVRAQEPGRASALKIPQYARPTSAIGIPRKAGRAETTKSRLGRAFDPLGVHLGGFTAFPKLTLEEDYNDNIFAVSRGTTSDFITIIQPNLAILSNWNNHALGVYADAAIGRYADHPTEDYEDYGVGADGRLDIRRNSMLTGNIRFARQHERRTSPNDVGGKTPTVFRDLAAQASYLQYFNRLSVELDGSLDRFNFDDVPAANGTINNDDRDRKDIDGTLRLGYAVLPQSEVFLQSRINTRPYDQTRDSNGFARSSHGYEVEAGAAVNFSGVTKGELFAGYTSQDYDDRRLKTIKGITFGGSVTWMPTGLTMVKSTLTRSVEETILSSSSGYFDTRLRFDVQHELRRYLVLNIALFASEENFQGISRTDYRWGAGIGAKYLLNRSLHVSLNYNYQQRNSIRQQNFNRNLVLLSVELQR